MDPAGLLLWVDNVLLVVNKPAGLPSLPDGYNPTAPYLKSVLEPEFGRLYIVHRLDRNTSGVMVLARTREAHRSLNGQFDRREVSKVYHALVAGNPDWSEKSLDAPLRPNGDRRHRTLIDSRGKPAATDFRVLQRLGRYTLVEALPHTGRTHQIRVHLSYLGLPILCDDLYGDGAPLYRAALNPGLPEQGPDNDHPILDRLALHAWALAFRHPTTGEDLHFQAPYPDDFARTLRLLSQP